MPALLHHTIAVLAALAAALLGVVVLNVLYQLLAPRDPTKPPVVFHWVPVVGCAVSYGMDPYKFLFDAREKYGAVFTFPLIGKSVTACLGPLGSNAVLNGRLSEVNAEQAYTNVTTPVFGTEVVYDCPNSKLMEQKKFIKFGLTADKFKSYVGIIVGEVEDYFTQHGFIEPHKAADRMTIDAYKASSEITVCTASATLQGPEVRAGMNKSFADLYHDLDGGFTPLNFVFPNLPLPSYRKRDAAQAKMREFYLDIMKNRRENGTDANDVLEALQNQHYKNGEPLTDKQIAHIMIALLMAGQHTSASTGAWTMLHMAHAPEVQDALYKEQVEVFGNKDGSFRPLTYEELNTPVLSAFVKEILRLHPPLHSIMRKVIGDMPVPTDLASPFDEPSGPLYKKNGAEGMAYTIPKGNFVLAAPGVTQVDPAIWGAEALKFDLKRWMGGPGQLGEEDQGEEDYGYGLISKGGKSAYLPFGAGRHRCVGEQFATLQIGTIVATLVRSFSMTVDPGTPFPANDYSTMLVMPLKPRAVTFSKRS